MFSLSLSLYRLGGKTSSNANIVEVSAHLMCFVALHAENRKTKFSWYSQIVFFSDTISLSPQLLFSYLAERRADVVVCYQQLLCHLPTTIYNMSNLCLDWWRNFLDAPTTNAHRWGAGDDNMTSNSMQHTQAPFNDSSVYVFHVDVSLSTSEKKKSFAFVWGLQVSAFYDQPVSFRYLPYRRFVQLFFLFSHSLFLAWTE